MSISILDSTGAACTVLCATDFAPEAFECTLTGLVPTVVTDGITVTGDGTPADPLVATATSPFTVAASSGPSQTISPGDTLSILEGNGIDTVASATDTVTVSARLSTDANNIIVFGGDTGLFAQETINAILDTNCINLTLAGKTLSAAPIIVATVGTATTSGNLLSCTASGLLAQMSLTSTNTCVAGGVGTTGTGTDGQGNVVGYMVRTVSFSNTVLRVDAAPEHTTRGASTSEQVVIPLPNISPLGTINSATFPALPSGYQFVNPSACRQMTIFTFTQFLGQLTLTTVGQWIIRGQVSVNSGAFVTVVQSGFGVVPGTIGLPYYHATQDIRTLAAGANFTWQVRHQVQTTVAATAGAQWTSYATNITSIGSSV